MTSSQSTPGQQSGGGGTNGWGLRYPGLVMGKGGTNEVKEFLGMWPLKPDVDLEVITKTLSPGGWDPPDKTFAEMTTKLGLIRAARWFVARTQDFDGYTLFFVSQFDGSLEKYLDDFVLNGAKNLLGVWGQCVGCPTGPNATAHDIVEFIARGQIKTLAVYDVFPSLSLGQVYKMADWYDKTQKFQRSVGKGDGNLEEKVTAFFNELAEAYEPVRSDAAVDTDAGRERQYEDVGEHIKGMRAGTV